MLRTLSHGTRKQIAHIKQPGTEWMSRVCRQILAKTANGILPNSLESRRLAEDVMDVQSVYLPGYPRRGMDGAEFLELAVSRGLLLRQSDGSYRLSRRLAQQTASFLRATCRRVIIATPDAERRLERDGGNGYRKARQRGRNRSRSYTRHGRAYN